MADISIPSTVTPQSGATEQRGVAGAAITAGELIYKDTSTNTYKVAQADAEDTAVVAGVAVNSAAINQEVKFVTGGRITDSGLTLTVGTAYFLSQSTAGDIQPVTDNFTGDWVTFVGIAITATVLELNFLAAGVQVPA